MTDIGKFIRTIYTAPAEAAGITLAVETDTDLADRYAVRGHPYLAPGMAYVADWAPPPPQATGPLWNPDLMDLDANDGYWRP